ncbi:phage holin family protein [Nocardioides sp. Kera G14]|uniref:phage holin family protein n=1 Tax=Nocardioides sp. Kera G14 TaxID=2884264 RepID=UPI001D122C28|nr:phage holin family protein [Nocardioides sp. Kera G14]UDY23756.1 phage holin family protein [Nocardioides sp. Kera G14]
MTHQSAPEAEPTIGRLVADASRDISTLISKEIELAKSEIKVSVTNGGVGAALFAVAGFLLVLAIIMFSIAVAFLIHWNGSGLDLQWAFLIVFGFYVLLAVICVLIGIRKVKRVKAPERAIAQGKEIPKALKGKA